MKSAILLLVACLWLGAVVGHVVPAEDQPKPMHINTPPALCPLQCRLRGVYNVPHFRSCSSFYRCVQGIPVELDCPGYLVFDHVTLQCRSYDEARCLFEGPVVPELE